jgi:pimeloyl-ACP methyl ester carboxylesterase
VAKYDTACSVIAHTQERARQLFDRDDDLLGEHGRSFVLSHGELRPRAAVLFHGMTASPMQFIEIARALHRAGYNVLVPRLPRHGYRDRLTDVLLGLSPAELKTAARAAVDFARGLGNSVTVIGFSVGGLLAAWTAQHCDITRAVCIAPFLGVAWVPTALADAAAALTLNLPNRFHWWDPIKRERQMPAHGYPRYSTHAVARAHQFGGELLREAQERAPRASSILVVTNTHEVTVNNRRIRTLVERWRKHGGAAVETFEFRDLPFCHDIIEPLRRPDVTARVYPVLLDLIER